MAEEASSTFPVNSTALVFDHDARTAVLHVNGTATMNGCAGGLLAIFHRVMSVEAALDAEDRAHEALAQARATRRMTTRE